MPTSNYVDKIKQDGTSYDIHDTELRNSKGQANGIASLDATGKVPSSQLPDSTDTKVTQTATTTDANYEVLFSETADNTTRTEGAGKAATLRFNPSTGSLMEGSNTVASETNSHAEGISTTASGRYSHVEGYYTCASGAVSHAEGSCTTAQGPSSHAEGAYTLASGNNAHAEGQATCASGIFSHAEGCANVASGQYAHAEGDSTTASGTQSHTEGYMTSASGNGAHAEGSGTTANDDYTHAEGYNTSAFGLSSHAEGYSSIATHNYTHAEGFYTCASGINSHTEGEGSVTSERAAHAEGLESTASGIASHSEGYRGFASGNGAHAEGGYASAGDYLGTFATGENSHAEGYLTTASGKNSHAEGNYTCANGIDSHAEGTRTKANSTDSHAEGSYTYANGTDSHAEGYRTSALAYASHAEGYATSASGSYSHAEGSYNSASGKNSHAEGNYTCANGTDSHAEGYQTRANSADSHAEGSYTCTSGTSAHAEGYDTIASGKYSHAAGEGTCAAGQAQTVVGKFNIADTTSLFIVGNGTSSARSNALLVASDGTTTLGASGTITSGNSQAVTGGTVYTALGNKLDASLKGAANGVAELDSAGLVPSSQLPSFVDDVIEVADYAHLPITGESGKIYVTLDTNLTYRWSGSEYVEVSKSLALGETSSTAYRGDRGKTAYDHATETRLTTATASGLYKVASTKEGHIASLTAVVKADITALGIPGSDTNTTYSLTQDSSDGHKITLTPSSGSAQTVTIPDNDSKVTSSANHYTPATASGQDKSASASGATAAWSIDVVKGVTLNTDGKGHVTGISVTSGKIPGNPNTDRYVNSAAFADDTTNNANSPVKMTLTRAGSDTATVTANIPKVSSSGAGVVPKGAAVSSQSQTTKFLREDGSWAAPSYPTVNNATLTIQKNGTTVKTFTANASTDVTANITVPTKVSELTNDSGYTTNTGTVTSVATGAGLTGGTIQGSGTIKAYMKSEIKATYDSNTITNTQNKQYAVVPDKTGYLSVNVPWDNTWRGIQNNLTSDSTTDSLSAAQGKALANGSARDSTKLPLAGGTMTGDIIFNKTGATDLTQVQMKCGANDYGRIAAGGSSNAGYLEIATADDGNEPIYARQYTGVYTSLQRTATILDGSGNTSFPGKLTASKAINELLTGSGTTAQDKGSGVSPRYFPALWKMNVGIATPADGDMVTIKIPCAGHDFGVFLSLDNGTTYKPIGLKTQDNGRLTTHFGNGKIITLMYDSTAVVDQVFAAAGADARSNIIGAWKVITSYLDGNTYDRNVFGWTNIKAWGTALTAGNIIVGINGVFHHLKEGTAFDITYPILYLAANVAANGTNSNVYNSINFTVTTTQSITLTNYLPVYIKGTLNGNLFTPVSTTPLTQTIPTAWDGYDYIELGMATSSTNIYLEQRHKIFAFRCGIFAEQIHNAMNTVKAWQDSDGNAINTTYLKKSGGTMTGALALNGDLQLKPSSSSSNDSPDIVWYYGNGQEKARLWTADTYSAASGLTYRLYKSDGTSLYNGTIPLTDTKNTAGSTDTSSKIFLIGATSQAANPQTYSDNEVYATSGVLTTKSVQVGGTAATMQYNSTNKCIDFVFA